jgi:hypothetical protein
MVRFSLKLASVCCLLVVAPATLLAGQPRPLNQSRLPENPTGIGRGVWRDAERASRYTGVQLNNNTTLKATTNGFSVEHLGRSSRSTTEFGRVRQWGSSQRSGFGISTGIEW